MKYNFIKIFISLIFTFIIFNFNNIFAFTEVKSEINNNELIKTFSVLEKENNDFLQFINLDIIDNQDIYHFNTYTKVEDEDITKNIESSIEHKNLDTNNSERIKEMFGNTYEFDDSSYKGTLQISNIEFVPIYNGKHQEILEHKETITNATENELNNIPKTINKNGYTYQLVNVDFEIENTIQIDNNAVPTSYKYTSTYQTIIEVDNPYTYNCIITYAGEVTKINPISTYIVSYCKENIVTNSDNNNKISLLPVSIIFILIFIPILYFIFRYNVKIYNNINGKYKLIGRFRITKNNLSIKLDSKKYKFKSNLFKIKLNNNTLKKYKNRTIKMYLNDKYKNLQVNSNIIDFKL